jgi:pimeloyl-ACP methyl ester carboxylesterase
MRAAALAAASMVAAACAFAGWTWLNKDQTYAPDTPLAEQCDDVQTGAERITLVRDDGTTLGGALVGRPDAEVGVVLRQGAGQTICDWLPWASDLADATGVRVLLFDRRGRGSSPGEADLSAEPADLAAAADFLHRRGIEEVALAGSSMGNSVMFAALDQMAPAPCTIVAISPILVSSDSHGTVDGTPMARLPDAAGAE